jgi:hypothetical protein
MATTTPSFSWPVPTSSDLVKNGATAIESLGDAIDASMTDLKGGTTGQVLAKASDTDMDFTWSTPSTGGAPVNLLLNSNFALNQRAYVSAANLASGIYGFDRWKSNFTNTTLTFTASTQGQSLTINSGGGLQQIIEQGLVRAGTYTLSWTGTATARVYNSGGSAPSYTASPVTFTADGTANVVVEFTASGGTRTVSNVMFNSGTNTTWSLATPTLQTELAACQRYYQRYTPGAQAYGTLSNYGSIFSTTLFRVTFSYVTTMRTTPTAIDFSTLRFLDEQFLTGAISAVNLLGSEQGANVAYVECTASGLTPYRSILVQTNNSTSGYVGFSAEL